MSEPLVLIEKADGIAVMTLNRPERLNALIPPLNDAIERTANDLAKQDDVRVLVLTGAGKGFCSGADVKGWEGGSEPGKHPEPNRQELTAPSAQLVLPFRQFPMPVIGAINGVAGGAGFSLAMACDIRIASENARFASLFIHRAIVPNNGLSWTLPRILGPAKALEWMLTGEWMDAKTAESLGIVNRVVPQADLMTVTMALAKKIAAMPPIAAELTKKAVYRGLVQDLVPHLDLETHFQKLCFGTEDFKESTQAFLEKRAPKFKGR